MEQIKEIDKKKTLYRHLFLDTRTGTEVLGDILAGPLRFFDPPMDQETAIRQTVGKELLSLMDLWVGEGQSNSPRQFVSKLARYIEENEDANINRKSDSRPVDRPVDPNPGQSEPTVSP
jgi:hypothetical protein